MAPKRLLPLGTAAPALHIASDCRRNAVSPLSQKRKNITHPPLDQVEKGWGEGAPLCRRNPRWATRASQERQPVEHPPPVGTWQRRWINNWPRLLLGPTNCTLLFECKEVQRGRAACGRCPGPARVQVFTSNDYKVEPCLNRFGSLRSLPGHKRVVPPLNEKC